MTPLMGGIVRDNWRKTTIRVRHTRGGCDVVPTKHIGYLILSSLLYGEYSNPICLYSKTVPR